MDSKELKERRVIYRWWILEDSPKIQEHLEIAEKAIRLGERIMNAPNVSVKTKSSNVTNQDMSNPSPSIPLKRWRKPWRFWPYKIKTNNNSIVACEIPWSHSIPTIPISWQLIKAKRWRKPWRFGPYKKRNPIN